MSETIKINVEIEVPSGEYCEDCLFLNDNDRYKFIVTCNLFPNDRGIFTQEPFVRKFLSCRKACQKATEEQIEAGENK
jgi:hypothetical protein